MEAGIDKELLRARLKVEGYDTSQMDMDLAMAYEEALRAEYRRGGCACGLCNGN